MTCKPPGRVLAGASPTFLTLGQCRSAPAPALSGAPERGAESMQRTLWMTAAVCLASVGVLLAQPPGEEGPPPGPPPGGQQGGPPGEPPRKPRIIELLDADDDGVISAEELQNAGKALLALDMNRDGQLSENEYRPPRGPGGQGGPGGPPRGPEGQGPSSRFAPPAGEPANLPADAPAGGALRPSQVNFPALGVPGSEGSQDAALAEQPATGKNTDGKSTMKGRNARGPNTTAGPMNGPDGQQMQGGPRGKGRPPGGQRRGMGGPGPGGPAGQGQGGPDGPPPGGPGGPPPE